ncbi:MAG: hypothetical protein LBV74_08100 [Tannerella sp.]|jgi:hypothetical protein|nr:hypothetical protein [Tannerella sp.]
MRNRDRQKNADVETSKLEQVLSGISSYYMDANDVRRLCEITACLFDILPEESFLLFLKLNEFKSKRAFELRTKPHL